MNSRKIIFYSAQLASQPNSAGAVRCGILVSELKKSDGNVELWSHGPQRTDEGVIFYAPLPSNQDGFGVRFIKEVAAGIEFVLRIAGLRLRGTDCIFILSSPPYIICLMAAWACRLFSITYLLDIRDLYPEVYFEQSLISEGSIMGQLQKYLVTRFYRGAKHIFTVTEGFRKIIARHTGDNASITLVRNGFDERMFTVNTKTPQRFTCVFHGNLGHMQNIDLLIEVAEQLEAIKADVQILVAGSGAQAEKVKRAESKNLQYLGELDYPNISGLLAKSNLGLSFRTDGVIGETAFPVKVFEYIGAGIPSIVTPPGEAGRLLVQKGIGWQFQNSDVKGIVNQIANLPTDTAMYEQTRPRLLAVRGEFSRQTTAKIFVTKVLEFWWAIGICFPTHG